MKSPHCHTEHDEDREHGNLHSASAINKARSRSGRVGSRR